MTTEGALGITPVAEGFSIIRLQPDCFVVVRDGFLMPTEGALGITPVAEGSGIVRF